MALVEEEADLVLNAEFAFFNFFHLTDVARICAAANALDVLKRLFERLVPTARRESHSEVSARAVVAEANGELEEAAQLYAAAAEAWREFPAPLEEGLAWLGAGRCRVALSGAAQEELRHGREVLMRLDARPSVAEADVLLASSIAQSS
jgi:hypothetical protein